MQLKDSTVLITGGTSGIGLELVKQLSGQSADIIIMLKGKYESPRDCLE